MKKRRLLLFSISISLLLMFSLLVYSQVKPVNDEYITQDVFINILVKTLGLEEQLSNNPQTIAATSSDKAALLASYNIAPLGGWDLTKVITKGDTAYVICQVLGIKVQSDQPGADISALAIKALVDQGIMIPGGANLPFNLGNLLVLINSAAAKSDKSDIKINNRPPWAPGPPPWAPGPPDWIPGPPSWHEPISPTR